MNDFRKWEQELREPQRWRPHWGKITTLLAVLWFSIMFWYLIFKLVINLV